jgi:hypothetical protein
MELPRQLKRWRSWTWRGGGVAASVPSRATRLRDARLANGPDIPSGGAKYSVLPPQDRLALNNDTISAPLCRARQYHISRCPHTNACAYMECRTVSGSRRPRRRRHYKLRIRIHNEPIPARGRLALYEDHMRLGRSLNDCAFYDGRRAHRRSTADSKKHRYNHAGKRSVQPYVCGHRLHLGSLLRGRPSIVYPLGRIGVRISRLVFGSATHACDCRRDTAPSAWQANAFGPKEDRPQSRFQVNGMYGRPARRPDAIGLPCSAYLIHTCQLYGLKKHGQPPRALLWTPIIGSGRRDVLLFLDLLPTGRHR